MGMDSGVMVCQTTRLTCRQDKNVYYLQVLMLVMHHKSSCVGVAIVTKPSGIICVQSLLADVITP